MRKSIISTELLQRQNNLRREARELNPNNLPI